MPCEDMKEGSALVDEHFSFETWMSSMAYVLFRMEGGELYEEIVKRKTFTEADAAELVRQLSEALAYLHARGIVHRFLKVSPVAGYCHKFLLIGWCVLSWRTCC